MDMGMSESSFQILPVSDQVWLEFVCSQADATVFHHPFWSNCIARTYGYRPFVLVMRNSAGEVVGGLPIMEVKSWLTGKRWVSLPFTDHCNPLVADPPYLEGLSNWLSGETIMLEGKRVETRFGMRGDGKVSRQSKYYAHFSVLDPQPEKLYKTFRKKGVQYCIKKAMRSEIDVSLSRRLDALNSFYDLHLMTRKKLGVPTQPKAFFRNLWETLITPKMGFTALAEYRGRPVAAGVFLHYNKYLVYKYGATDPDYLNLYANHLLLWEVIQWACKNDMAILDWGKTDKHNEGLRKFKLGWGPEEQELTYSYIGQEPKEYSSGWKKQIVEKTIQNSPVWVGKMIGNLLYKHVG